MQNVGRLRRLGLLFAMILPLPLLAGADPADYSQARNWVTLPNASQPVDVFFVYPTTYFPSPQEVLGATWTAGWNQSLAQAYNDRSIKFHITSKTGVFTKAGTNLYAPYFQQAAGLPVLQALLFKSAPQNAAAAEEALEAAYTDVANAFDYYMTHFNKDSAGNPRPFILAGHSQGSNLLLMLLERKFKDPALRKLLVTAYIIGWSVTSDDMASYPLSLQQVGICGIPVSRQTGCIVTYNTQQNPGDWSVTPGNVGLVKKNAYSVNPLTWVATGPGAVGPAASAARNMGAHFYQGQLLTFPPIDFTPDQDTGNLTYEIDHYTGAQSNNGALVINPMALPYPANYFNLLPPYNTLPGWYHSYDYTFFYRNLQQDVIDRIEVYRGRM